MSSKTQDSLKISLVQVDLHWEDKRANLAMIEDKISLLKSSDIIILPEMYTTGFSMATDRLAEPWEGSYTLYWMKEMAISKGADIVGSFIVRLDQQYYNRLAWVAPEGKVWYYDKRHLFTLAGEQNHYTRGEDRLIIERKGWKIMPLVCYDVRFPVWSRNTENVDLMIYVANFPAKRIDAWTSLLKARAIENQAYVAAVNIVGENDGISYCGGSYIYDYNGQILADCGDKANICTTTITMEEKQNFTKRFAFLQDQDVFEVK